MIRVVLVDDHAGVREMLSSLLTMTGEVDIDIVGQAEDPESAREVAGALHPDVAIVDVSMPHGGGVRATRLIRDSSPPTRVLVYSGTGDTSAVLEMLRLGAVGYVPKGADLALLHRAVTAAAEGVSVIAGDVVSAFRRELDKVTGVDPVTRQGERIRVEACLDAHGYGALLQPIVDLATRQAVGFEALARFAEGTPDEWFALAWRSGYGVELELRMLEDALAWLPRIPAPLYLSLNVSPTTLSHPATEELVAAHASRIILEITEHASIDDTEKFRESVQRLGAQGVRVAVDDAGAGFGNLVRFLHLVPDVIKLDRLLVADIDQHPVRVELTRSLVTLGSGIGAIVTAEGVERDEEANALINLGVTTAQGYLFGRPDAPSHAIDRALSL